MNRPETPVPSADDEDAFADEFFNPIPSSYFNEGERSLANVENGWAKAAVCLRTLGAEHFGHHGGRRLQGLPAVHESIEVWRRRYEAGDTLSLLQAIKVCAEENLPLPTWLASAYQAALKRFLEPGGPLSLDAVFYSDRLPTDTPAKAAAARQDWQLGIVLWSEAWKVAMADQTIQSVDAVVETVLSQREFGVKKTKARSLILMVEDSQREHLGSRKDQHLSRFLAKRRKR